MNIREIIESYNNLQKALAPFNLSSTLTICPTIFDEMIYSPDSYDEYVKDMTEILEKHMDKKTAQKILNNIDKLNIEFEPNYFGGKDMAQYILVDYFKYSVNGISTLTGIKFSFSIHLDIYPIQ